MMRRRNSNRNSQRGNHASAKVRKWLWKSSLNKKTKARVVQAVVESTMLFDCNARMWTKTDIGKMQSIADKCYRRIWNNGKGLALIRMEQEHVNMFDVRNELGITSMRTKVEIRALERLGHVLRMPDYRLTKRVVLGRWRERRKERGCMRGGLIAYWKRLVAEAGHDWTNVANLASDRKRWKALVRARRKALDEWEAAMGHRSPTDPEERSQSKKTKEELTCRWDGCQRKYASVKEGPTDYPAKTSSAGSVTGSFRNNTA